MRLYLLQFTVHLMVTPNKILTNTINFLEFQIKSPVSLQVLGLSADTKGLGLGFQSMFFSMDEIRDIYDSLITDCASFIFSPLGDG